MSEETKELISLFDVIIETYDLREFIERLIDYADLNSALTESDDEELEVEVDEEGFLSLK